MAMRLLDRERALLDRFVSLLENTEMIPGTALSLYAEVVSKHMELLAFRQVSLVPNRKKNSQGCRHFRMSSAAACALPGYVLHMTIICRFFRMYILASMS